MIAQPENAKTATTQPRQRINGRQFLDAFAHAANIVADHREQLNALNVFPVPDGDTGTNMSLTMRSAIEMADQIAHEPAPTVGGVASKIAFGALMGARGNSGVILSQILRGFATSVEDLDELDGAAIAHALDKATEVAYKAVIKPVEGTMLSVINDAARAATVALATSSGAGDILAAAADGAEESLAHTPDSLEVLRQARVVDSGGQGVVYLLRALANHVRGDFAAIQIGDDHPVPALANITIVADDIHSGVSGYCTNFMVSGANIDLDLFRERLGTIGDSAVLVGDPHLFKVHVHTERPDQALTLALEFGSLDRVAIENLGRQADEVAAMNAAQQAVPETMTHKLTGKQAVVTVADGRGLANALISMGATSVILYEHEGKPSTEEMLRAVESAPAEDVILLPNESETIAAAKLVTSLTDKRISIVPSTSIVQGLAALSAMSTSADLATNTDQMTRALADATWAEIARAVRDATVDGKQVRTGDILCFINGKLEATGAAVDILITDSLGYLKDTEPEICTVFSGKNVDPQITATVERSLNSLFPEADIEVIDGGQSFYLYVIAFE